MAWDPNQGQGQPPNSGQDQPPYSGYGNPQPNPNDPNAQNPYGTPPPQYGTPPPQNPYGNPAYQQAGYQQPGGYQQGGYGYAPPQQPMAPARPVGQAIQELPNQYINVVTHPSDTTFAAEIPKADWPMVFVQLGILIAASVILGLIASAIVAAVVHTTTGSASAAAAVSLFAAATTVSGALLSIILIPLFFFIGVGIQFLLAKAFSGQGTFLAQAYTQLLYKVPMDIGSAVIGTVLSFVPIVGGLVGLAFFVYSVVLNIFQIKAVHRLSGGKAAAVVLIPYAVVLLIGLLCLVTVGLAILGALQNAH